MAKGFKILIVLMFLSIVVAGLWNKFTVIRDAAHFVLDPSAGAIIQWNADIGMLIVVALITLITTIVSYLTMDKELMADIKREQKMLQKEMEKFKEHPDKMLEINKKQLALMPKTLDVTMRPALFTFIPLILLLRWFNDFFVANPVKIFGILSWFWAYFLFTIIFSIIFRKVFKMP